MASRMLRDWTQSEPINSISAEAEVFFVRLIMKADDYGNYTAHPKLLSAALYPLKTVKEAKIMRLIEECSSAGIITKYQVDGKDYLNIPNFGQRLRTMTGKWPTVDGGARTNVSNARPEEKRREEEKELEEEVRREGEISLADFEKLFDEIWIEQMEMVHPGKDIPKAIREAYAHLGAGGRLLNGTTADFKKTINSWLSNQKPQQRKKAFEL